MMNDPRFSDIVDELRWNDLPLDHTAADEIERLREELALEKKEHQADAETIWPSVEREMNRNQKLRDAIEDLTAERDKYREAAEIFRDFGEFDLARREYDKKQLARAQRIMTEATEAIPKWATGERMSEEGTNSPQA